MKKLMIDIVLKGIFAYKRKCALKKNFQENTEKSLLFFNVDNYKVCWEFENLRRI